MYIRTLIDMNKHIHTTLFTLNINKLICKSYCKMCFAQADLLKYYFYAMIMFTM